MRRRKLDASSPGYLTQAIDTWDIRHDHLPKSRNTVLLQVEHVRNTLVLPRSAAVIERGAKRSLVSESDGPPEPIVRFSIGGRECGALGPRVARSLKQVCHACSVPVGVVGPFGTDEGPGTGERDREPEPVVCMASSWDECRPLGPPVARSLEQVRCAPICSVGVHRPWQPR